MREILFKAKRLDNGEWIEGSLLQTTAVSLKSFIVHSACYTSGRWDWAECVKVDTETICQYTGLMDKSGNKIWENDFVKFEDVGEEGYEYKEGFDFDNVAKVVFCNGRWELDNFGEYNSGVYEEMNDHYELFTTLIHSKVIGNAFDNPELESDEDYIDDYETNYLLDFLGIDHDKYSWFE